MDCLYNKVRRGQQDNWQHMRVYVLLLNVNKQNTLHYNNCQYEQGELQCCIHSLQHFVHQNINNTIKQRC